MRRLILQNGKYVYVWGNEKSDEQLAAENAATNVVKTVVKEVAKVVEDVVEIAKVAVPTEKITIEKPAQELLPVTIVSGSGVA